MVPPRGLGEAATVVNPVLEKTAYINYCFSAGSDLWNGVPLRASCSPSLERYSILPAAREG